VINTTINDLIPPRYTEWVRFGTFPQKKKKLCRPWRTRNFYWIIGFSDTKPSMTIIFARSIEIRVLRSTSNIIARHYNNLPCLQCTIYHKARFSRACTGAFSTRWFWHVNAYFSGNISRGTPKNVKLCFCSRFLKPVSSFYSQPINTTTTPHITICFIEN
jgi:hypothetical protein